MSSPISPECWGMAGIQCWHEAQKKAVRLACQLATDSKAGLHYGFTAAASDGYLERFPGCWVNVGGSQESCKAG